jgi:NIMA (never in mitosis gene a)-related kinase 1/4/5
MDRYVKVRELGRGSFGCAVLVQDRSKAYCVVKEIMIGHLPPQERDATEKEAHLLSQMHHSNIVTYVESFVEKR